MKRDLDVPDGAGAPRPSYLLLVVAGWGLVGALAGWEIYESHSLALVFQISLMVAVYGAYQTFGLLRGTSVPQITTARQKFFCSPVVVLGALFLQWAIGGILSQAIFGTVWSHDYYSLTTLRMLGGRIKPGVQNRDELRQAFEQLIAYNKPFTAERFLEAGMNPDLVYAHQPTVRSLLAEAVLAQRPAIVRSLLTHGADPNPSLGESPLWLAVETRNPQIIELLLQHGAKVALTDPQRAIAAPEMLALLRNAGAIR